MRAALAALPIAALLAGSCGGNAEPKALVTVVPECGPALTDCGWSMPVQLTVAQHGRRLFDVPLGHVTDLRLSPGRYAFALYDKACPAKVTTYGAEHVMVWLKLYENAQCEMWPDPVEW